MQYYPNGHNDHLDNILNLNSNICFLECIKKCGANNFLFFKTIESGFKELP